MANISEADRSLQESLTGYTKQCSSSWLFLDVDRGIWHSQSWVPTDSFGLHNLALLCVCLAQVDRQSSLLPHGDLTGSRELLLQAAVGV